MNPQQYKEFQRNCLLREFITRQKQAKQLERNLSSNLSHLEKILSSVDYINIKRFYHEVASRTHKNIMPIHQKKLEKLNGSPVGQSYDEMKSKIIHNISSYTLSNTEERLLCRWWDLCIENKLLNFLEFETDVELSSMKLESSCHNSVFRTICRQIYNASEQLKRACKKKKVSNLSDDELAVLKSLKLNKNISIYIHACIYIHTCTSI